ncbi:tRNA pseudouridine synthase B [Paraliobacillus quinghaiensis]|uniref:tRNA pseudouridine synthase B n=1 Tax=Paraliobacillus quinghaiensis TaxID=470815 RepID=A0A917TFN6_9BACI|nr:tRNA pseudouridine(55) synthase TruB [Paraliobacillus quinghaiensis]GGM21753.1 tRNA pseudouridine synthase B [Paraliobacillus quinghaiensis]
MHGIIPLWKPIGPTSHDCVIKMRKLFKTKKVGHTGTLDPAVEGVLPICIGQATKIVPYLTDTKKTYIAEVTLGYSTDTEDQTGTTLEKKEVSDTIEIETLKHTLERFVGQIEQVVPLYSAVRVNGKKLYEYARANEPVTRPSREVTIESISLLEDTIKAEGKLIRFSIQATCSKGTYIRTLCVDIGNALGYPAHMSKLVRTQTGSFTAEQTYSFDELNELAQLNKIESTLVPIHRGVEHLDVYKVDEKLAEKVRYGQKLPFPDQQLGDRPFRVEYDDELLAIYQVHPTKPDEIKPMRVFPYND